MIRTTLNWTVKNLKAMRDEKETLSFNHPIQRQSAQWTNEQQSLLIHSMLADFPVPSVYVHKMESTETDAKGKHTYSYSVLDGKQRMTTVFSYIDGEFALSEDTPDVTLEDVEYEIAGKYFDDLDEDVQQEILRFKFNIQSFESVSDDTIEEIFFRLNNSSPLTKPQKAKPLMGVDNSIFVNGILDNRFFKEKCNFTKAQLRNSDDMCTLIQCMMLLDYKYRDYQFESISADAVMKYSQYIKGNYPDECRCKLKKIVAFLDNIFYMKEKNLRKVNIPIVFMMADKALSLSISGTNFRRWFMDFFEKHKTEYGQFCSSGSIKREKTLGRIEVMERCFNDYFRTEVDEATEQKGSVENELIETTESTAQGIDSTEEAGQESPDTEQAEASSDEAAEGQADNASNEPSETGELPDSQEADGPGEQENPNASDNEADEQENVGGPDSEADEQETADGSDGDSDRQENSGGSDDEAEQNGEDVSNTQAFSGSDEESFPDGSNDADGSDDIDTESSSVAEDADSKVSTGSHSTFKRAFSMFSLLGN